jgi:hypothetical protein
VVLRRTGDEDTRTSGAIVSSHLNPSQIAARMRPIIERWLGEPFDVERLLADPVEGREVMFVCQASKHPELIRLSQMYAAAVRAVPVLKQEVRMVVVREPELSSAALQRVPRATQAAVAAPQEAVWARNTSGFGLTQPPSLESPRDTDTPSTSSERSRWQRVLRLGRPGSSHS